MVDLKFKNNYKPKSNNSFRGFLWEDCSESFQKKIALRICFTEQIIILTSARNEVDLLSEIIRDTRDPFII